jgi:hypothetical protein
MDSCSSESSFVSAFATIAFKTTIVAVAVSQLTGLLYFTYFINNTISARNCVGC